MTNLKKRRIAIGDIHGCYKAIHRILEEEIRISPQDEIFLLGDIVSKGPESGKTIDYILDLINSGYQIRGIKGNHEYKILTLLNIDYEMFEEYLERYNCFDLLDKNVENRIKYLRELPYYIELENWLLLHSEINFERSPGPRDLRMMFNNDSIRSLVERGDVSKKGQIFGHHSRKLDIILSAIQKKQSRIGIDGGYVYKEFGYLIGLDLDSYQTYVVGKANKDR